MTALVLAYMGPISGYLSQRSELRDESARLAELEQTRDGLRAQIAALETSNVLEARARAIGMVKPGERAFIVRGDLAGDPVREAPDDDDGPLSWLGVPF